MKHRTKSHDDWETPKWLLDYIKVKYFKGDEFFDPCPIDYKQYVLDDGLKLKHWHDYNFINPPYCLSSNSFSDATPKCIGNFGIRRLTPIECARLQNFPDLWAYMLSNSRQYKAYGNAVNVEVVKHIIRCMIG